MSIVQYNQQHLAADSVHVYDNENNNTRLYSCCFVARFSFKGDMQKRYANVIVLRNDVMSDYVIPYIKFCNVQQCYNPDALQKNSDGMLECRAGHKRFEHVAR